MTTELQAHADKLAATNDGDWVSRLILENDDLRRQCERLRRESDEYRSLIIQMRKKVSDVMHSSLDELGKGA